MSEFVCLDSGNLIAALCEAEREKAVLPHVIQWLEDPARIQALSAELQAYTEASARLRDEILYRLEGGKHGFE